MARTDTNATAPSGAPGGDIAGPDAVKTYRYLRLAMIGLVVMLGAAVGLEWWATGRRCLQTSISAYYYTPAQSVFVGSLVAIGACLVVIKGSTEWEDLLLNIAGMLAPVVAFVPTPDHGVCRSVPVPTNDTAANVANNVGALLVLGVVGLVLTIVLARRERRTGEWSRTSTIGVVLSVLLFVTVWVTYTFARPQFLKAAHYVAAGILFVCIVAVVALNAKWFGQEHARGATPTAGDYVNRYGVLAVLMAVSVGGILLYRQLFGWEHALLWTEASLITLFAAFWATQTKELWDKGLRTVGPPPTTSR